MTAHPVRLADRPDIWQVDGFLSDEEIEAVTALFLDQAFLDASAMSYGMDKAGFCAETETCTSPILISARNRVADTLGLPREAADTVRFRWYRESDWHPPHTDAFVIDDTILAVSALVYLETTDEGGETAFDVSLPAPVAVRPVRGRLVAWTNLDADGNTDPHSRHEARAVTSGEKGSLLFFFYLPRPATHVRLQPGPLTAQTPPPPS